MKKLMIVAVAAAAVAGCVCPNCTDLSTRLDKLEAAKAAKAAKLSSMRQAKADKLAAEAAVRESKRPASDPALICALEARYRHPRVVEQWDNGDGTETRVILQAGNVSTNTFTRVNITAQIGPAKYSKKAIGDALAHMGYWPQIKTMLQSTETEGGRTFWDVWVDSAWFLENDPVFLSALEGAKQALGVTQEQLDEMLKSCLY